MKILYLEPFYGGSHKDFALGFKEHSQHEVDLVTLPDRFWRWRMRGAALYFLEQIKGLHKYDAIFATDMMDVTNFIGLAKDKVPPIVLYFHENQLSYPLPPGGKRDFHAGFTNITSAFAADRVLFNSQYHYDAFMTAAARLIRRLPDYPPKNILEAIQEKTQVAYPGCRFESSPVGDAETQLGPPPDQQLDPPLIIWNHRWEFDKNPEFFFDVLKILKKEGVPFSLALLGEDFKSIPAVFLQAKKLFEDRIKVFGYVASKQDYISWLKKGSVIVSCAIQENFGISVVEAVRFGCIPLLPNRLSYPELVPKEMHSKILYRTKRDLVEKLKVRLVNSETNKLLRAKMSKEMEVFAWRTRVKQYDKTLKKLNKYS